MVGKQNRTDIDLDEFRKLLTGYKGHLTGLLHRTNASERGEMSDSTNESAYSSTDLSENSDTAALLVDLDREFTAEDDIEVTLTMIETALDRINDGTYGIDEVTGEPIPVARLRAIPWATMTVETAERVQ